MRKLTPLLSLALAGCYTYAAAPATEIPVGRDVRLALTDSGSAAMAALVGPRAATLEGRFVGQAPDALTMTVAEVTRFDGSAEGWRGERVTFPAPTVKWVQSRTFARNRTLGLTAGIVGAALLAVRAFGGGEDVTGGGGRGGGGGAGQ